MSVQIMKRITDPAGIVSEVAIEVTPADVSRALVAFSQQERKDSFGAALRGLAVEPADPWLAMNCLEALAESSCPKHYASVVSTSAHLASRAFGGDYLGALQREARRQHARAKRKGAVQQ